jgi:hypothetical protein
MAVFIELTAQDRARKRAHFWLMSIPSKSPACQSIRPADRCQCGWGNWYSHSRSYIAVSNFTTIFSIRASCSGAPPPTNCTTLARC